MARPPGSLGSQAPDRDRGEANVVTRVSQWADNHLRLVQNISTGMAIAGIMLLIRSIRLTSKFTTSSDIPVEFIRKKVKLRGRLQRITECGLEIEHIPITLPFISSWKKEPRGVLLVKLAGVELTEGGKVWLQSELKPSQLLWFQLLGKEDSALFCYLLVNKVNTAPSASISCVLTRRSCKSKCHTCYFLYTETILWGCWSQLQGGYFNVNLNEEILRRGLGKTVLVKGLNYDSKTHWKIHRNLLKAELTALKKGEGIWKEESEKESYFRKLKDSWRERWTKDNDLKPAGADLSSTKDSYYDSLRRVFGRGKDSVGNYSFLLKLREFVSRLHFRRKG
ncbi:protein C3orf33 homolog isoform X1 [Mus pahari]|uniref:protein C3orf33 homolog isoform X1 n=1 Tax=Mus pahari TaxID=10093 RepID=UPI001114C9D7|nr:protein C3orf33 homolog isoform X1 [Mus pahari]